MTPATSQRKRIGGRPSKADKAFEAAVQRVCCRLEVYVTAPTGAYAIVIDDKAGNPIAFAETSFGTGHSYETEGKQKPWVLDVAFGVES